MKFSNSLFFCFVLAASTLISQEEEKSFHFKKGEVLDVILLSQTKNSEELFYKYRQTIYPVGFEYTYQPQKGFRIAKLSLGTNKPNAFIFGKWSSLQYRQEFLSNIVKRVPDFHEQRRNLFPYFGLTYYEVMQDLSFSINTSKHTVVTALWNDPAKNNQSFFETWKANVINAGGKVIITLKDGVSPTGYYYNPDILCVIEWNDEADFKVFSENNSLDTYESMKNVHQFVIH